jgi:hypothetical protein
MLLPALEVLAMKDKYVKKLADILSQEKLVNSGLFPVKVHSVLTMQCTHYTLHTVLTIYSP